MDNMGGAPIIPINAQGTVAPSGVDLLTQVLQKLLEQNKPNAKLNDATPDQQAAAQETAKQGTKGKEKGAAQSGANIQKGDQQAGGLLPNLIDELFGASKGSESDSKKQVASGKSAEQYSGGLTDMMKTFKGEGGGQKGTVSSAMSFLKILGI